MSVSTSAVSFYGARASTYTAKKLTAGEIFNRVFYRRVISKYKHTRTEHRIHHINDRVNSRHLLTTTTRRLNGEVGANYQLCKWKLLFLAYGSSENKKYYLAINIYDLEKYLALKFEKSYNR